ncbi:hypothetical protein N7451_007232 [Penicillium sp. IBT 35674x]|nr:hypothetical protein N7451_007232 [Penicillium sp. IBT 35674x]
MSLDEVDGYADSLDDPPPMSANRQQEREWLNFDAALHDLSLNTFNAPTASWPHGPYVNLQDNIHLLDIPHHNKSVRIEHPEHQAVYSGITGLDTRSTQEQTWENLHAGSIFPLPWPSYSLGCFQYGVPQNTHEHVLKYDRHPPLAPSQQEPKRPTRDQAILSHSLGVANADTILRSQGAYSNLEYTDTPLNVIHLMASHYQPRDHTYSLASYIPSTVLDTSSITEQPMLGYNRAMAIKATPRYDQTDVPPHFKSFRCDWEGCAYKGTFRRKADLNRHTETQHVFPRAYRCPISGCERAFNRGDNLHGHLESVHGVPRPRR